MDFTLYKQEDQKTESKLFLVFFLLSFKASHFKNGSKNWTFAVAFWSFFQQRIWRSPWPRNAIFINQRQTTQKCIYCTLSESNIHAALQHDREPNRLLLDLEPDVVIAQLCIFAVSASCSSHSSRRPTIWMPILTLRRRCSACHELLLLLCMKRTRNSA